MVIEDGRRSPAFEDLLSAAERPVRNDIERIAIRRTEDGLGIHVPTRRNIALAVVLSLWMVGWYFGARFAIGEIFGGAPWPAKIFMVFWMAIWSAGGLGVCTVVLWQFFGVERLFIINGVLVTEQNLGRFRRRKLVPLSSVTKVRENLGKYANPGAGGGEIVYHVDGKPRSFGVGLSRAERDAVLKAIASEMPHTASEMPDPT